MNSAPHHNHGADLTLLTLVTALAVEFVRAAGPLLDRAFTNSTQTVAITALVTFTLPGLIVALFIAPRRISGRAVALAVAVLIVIRLALQGLTEAIAGGASLGGVRYALGLGGTTVALAVLVLVAGLVGGSPDDEAEPPNRWSPGVRVAVGVSMGTLLAAATSLALGTWDAYWRAGASGWLPAVALTGGIGACGWLVRRRAAVSVVPRGLWLLGPALALAIQVTANAAFISSQAGVTLPFGAAGIALAAAATAVVVPRLEGRRTTPDAPATHRTRLWPAALTLAAAALMAGCLLIPGRVDEPAAGSWALLGAMVLLAPLLTLLLAIGLDRGHRPGTWLRLTGTGTAVGLGVILPVLIYQIDYDVPLPFPNGWVPVATTLVLALPGARSAARTPRAVLLDVGAEPATHSAPGHLPPTRAARGRTRTATMPVRALATLTAATAALALVGVWQARLPATSEVADGPTGTLRILDWNLHYGVSADPSADLDEIAAVINETGADVVTLQEVSRGWVLGGGADMGTYLAHATGMRIAFAPAADRQFGNAILWDPRRGDPVDVDRTALPYGAGPQERSAITATIDAGGVPVRVTSVHLQHRAENTPTRLEQVRALFDTEPVAGAFVLAGDLNSEPTGPEIALVAGRKLTSAQDEAGDPKLATSPALDPVQRIDWVFGSSQVTFVKAEVLESVASDHRPLLVDLTAIG